VQPPAQRAQAGVQAMTMTIMTTIVNFHSSIVLNIVKHCLILYWNQWNDFIAFNIVFNI
jgi:hypothetical protein